MPDSAAKVVSELIRSVKCGNLTNWKRGKSSPFISTVFITFLEVRGNQKKVAVSEYYLGDDYLCVNHLVMFIDPFTNKITFETKDGAEELHNLVEAIVNPQEKREEERRERIEKRREKKKMEEKAKMQKKAADDFLRDLAATK